MENVMASFKTFFKNKNTVTIIGVIIILVLLYIGYSSQINKAVEPVSIPVATETIQPRTEITSDMVQEIDMPNISISDNVIRSTSQIVGKYSNINTVIPEGSMFYTDTVIDEDELPDAAFTKVKAGEVVYNFPVDMESTYGNSIFPGNKIDIYMKVGNGEDELIMIGKLIENIEVLAVKDSSGRAVFENTSEERSPSMLIFGLPADMYSLLKKASYMDDLGVELYPVPHGGEAPDEGATQVSTQQLVDYINAHSVDIPIVQDTIDASELVPTFSANKNNNMRVTVRFPEGCGSEYTCSYTVNNEDPVVVNDRRVTVTFDEEGTLTASVTEQSGEVHTATTNVPMANDEE